MLDAPEHSSCSPTLSSKPWGQGWEGWWKQHFCRSFQCHVPKMRAMCPTKSFLTSTCVWNCWAPTSPFYGQCTRPKWTAASLWWIVQPHIPVKRHIFWTTDSIKKEIYLCCCGTGPPPHLRCKCCCQELQWFRIIAGPCSASHWPALQCHQTSPWKYDSPAIPAIWPKDFVLFFAHVSSGQISEHP